MDRETFIKDWTKSLERGSGAVFIGAGLSCRAGYPNWHALLVDIAKELGLDIAQEHDLAGVAQYSLNQEVGKRHKLTQLIRDHFPPKHDPPEPFRILARLPLRHVWTTNYDKLIETAWAAERKHLDVKSSNKDLGSDDHWAHGVLYKMHGTVDHPADVVIAKNDYELYRRTRGGFLQVLTGHLASKQLLFLGFGFGDPNLAHLFASIRETFEENGPEHYAIVRRPVIGTGPGAKNRLKLDRVRHALWVQDLKRYGIQCVEVDKFEEVDDILRGVESRLAQRSVLVSGSFPDTVAPADLALRHIIEGVARGVGGVIAQRQKRLVSGFGLVVGSAAIAGALSIILAESAPNLEKSLLLRPFPQEPPADIAEKEFKRRYRDAMVQQAGICVFIGGLKDERHGGKTQRV
ncbi:MAG: SIR2 family protein, partial [Deltaproteobacteria bacterium]|nr:SIR2 family protein [Deltaproteobacteria bacterium]